MEYGNFLDFIYFSSFTLTVNFPDQLVTDMSEPVLKSRAPSGNGSMVIVIFCTKWKNALVKILEFI